MRAVSRILIALLLTLAGVAGATTARADPPAPPAAVPPDVALPSPLSLDAALDILRKRGLDLLVADAVARTAEGNAQTAAGIANPQASFSTGPMLNYDSALPGCTGCSREVVNAGLTDSAAILDALVGKRLLRVEVARDALAAARLSRADAQRNLEFQVKQAYTQVVLQAETLDLDREILKSLEATLAVSRAQYPRTIDEGGLARVEVQKLEGDQAISADLQTLRQAKIGLAFLLGARRLITDFEVERDTLKFRVPAALADTSPSRSSGARTRSAPTSRPSATSASAPAPATISRGGSRSRRSPWASSTARGAWGRGRSRRRT